MRAAPSLVALLGVVLVPRAVARRAWALAIAALAVLLVAPGAEAHFGTAKLGYRSTIEAVEPRLPGVELKVLYGDDQIWLANRTGRTIVIQGYSGEPYIRFDQAGIFVNVNSPAGYLNQDRYGQSDVPASASAEAKPEWHKLAGGEVWAWHDHRIHYMSPTLPPQIRREPRKPHHVFNWTVPATVDGKPLAISGTLDYEPPPLQSSSEFPLGLVIVLATLIAAGMVGLFFLRRILLRSLE